MEKLKFKAWMVEHKITQGALADLLGLSLQAINRKVNGKEDFSLQQIKTICHAYDISADIFLAE